MKKKVLSLFLLVAMLISGLGCTVPAQKVDASSVRYSSSSAYVSHRGGTEVKLWVKFAYREGWLGHYDHSYRVLNYGSVDLDYVDMDYDNRGSVSYVTFHVYFEDGYYNGVTFMCDSNGRITHG